MPALIVAGAQFVGNLMGKSASRKAQKREAERQYRLRQEQIANQAAQQAYKHEFDTQMLDLYNQRTMEEFDVKLDLYDNQLQINRDAAHSSYAAEQFKHIEMLQQASLNRNRMYKELLKVQGQQAARGETGNRSRARADLINSLGEFGRDQAEFEKYKKVKDPICYEISLPDIHYGKITDEPMNIIEKHYIQAIMDLHRKADGLEIDRFLLPVGNDGLNSEGMSRATTKGTPQQDNKDDTI